MAHTFNLSTGDAEAGEFQSSRPACFIYQVPSQPSLDSSEYNQNQKAGEDISESCSMSQ